MPPSHVTPSPHPLTTSQRDKEIDTIVQGFVTKSQANRDIYRAILECVLPLGAGVPGPIVARDELRQAVEKIKPGYRDPFRRVRELQGEEGLSGLVKDGNKYQLKYTDIDAKREPRRAVSQQTVQKLVHNQGERCTVCSKEISAEDTRIDVDHRVPRLRGGTTHETNLQVLCRECNIAKSTQCNGCDLICRTCGWAHPEKHRLLKLEPELVLQVNREASRSKKETPDQLANRLLSESLDQLRRSLQDQE